MPRFCCDFIFIIRRQLSKMQSDIAKAVENQVLNFNTLVHDLQNQKKEVRPLPRNSLPSSTLSSAKSMTPSMQRSANASCYP